MLRSDRILAVIPARGGSKRIKNKNTLLLAEKPLLAWTIDAAKGSKYIDKVVVSSDSEEIRRIAIEAGAEAPFLRPPNLSGDHASSADVVLHSLNFLSERGESFDTCILLQPTSPLRSAVHIDEAFELYEKLEAKSIISVTNIGHPIEWVNELGDAGQMDIFFTKGSVYKRSQDYPERYMINGAIYIFGVDQFKVDNSYFFERGSFAYVMRKKDSIDIDTYDDLDLAEMFLKLTLN
jgi:CMP-N,N'-diacetyllegionaminic acid synthase